MNYSDRIRPDSYNIYTYLGDLLRKRYQIPTFQREVVWERGNIKKLWDSIYRFYPLGSILIWDTNIKLQHHREIGGHVISDDSTGDYKYILDGQQRTTSLLRSIYGENNGNDGVDKTQLYIDLTIEDKDETDNESYKKRFLFWDEIDDRNGELKANTGKKKRYDEGLIIKLIDIKDNFEPLEEKIEIHPGQEYKYNHPVRKQLRKIRQVLDNYKVSFIELRGIQVSEVCQIFERINQSGKPLSIFDIVVAKTFKAKTETDEGFYLREVIENFRKINKSNFLGIDDLTYLQILTVLIKKKFPDSGVLNITDIYLNNIKTEHIKQIWASAEKALLKTFDFFESYLRLKGPQLIPYRYFYMTLAFYFFENKEPDYEFIKQYFWYYSFHNDDLLSNTTHLWNHIEFLNKEKIKEQVEFDRFLIDRNKLRTASYSSKGRLSRAILSLYASQDPRDWKYPDRSVLSDVYYCLTDKPNLHHIFPTDYITKNPGSNKLDSNTLMNIVYLTQITNLEISNKNPASYIKGYDKPEFEGILSNHLLPVEILEWSRKDEMPENALDIFIEKRIDKIIEELQKKIKVSKFEIIDTK